MAPLPKRKHSKARKGKRLNERKAEKSFPDLVICSVCGKRKLPHQQCKYCQSTDNTAAAPSRSIESAPEKNPVVSK